VAQLLRDHGFNNSATLAAAFEVFQRHVMAGLSNLVTLITVEGDRKPYVQTSRA
jgi:hypothetical protein